MPDKFERIWWKHGVIYHIYVLSFYDSNNDGKGDLRGIIQKLDYLKYLGVDAIWLSPIFKSPMCDFGYDVSDYYSVDPVFGSIEDFKELLNEAHSRNIRVILDMVFNHTSIQHQWFLESSSSKANPRRNWYIWHPPVKKRKPNNWKSAFGGSCWQFDKQTGEYYMHSFFPEQPDLNWRNKELRSEIYNILRYWLDLGVDGFRFDVINFIVKDKKFRNNPMFSGLFSEQKLRTRNHPKSYKYVGKIRAVLDEYSDRIGIGEIYTLPPGNPSLVASYVKIPGKSLHLAFDFSIFFVRWSAKKYFRAIDNWQKSISGNSWPANVFSNHDLLRSLNRFGFIRNSEQKAKVLAVLLLTLRGTPFIYYGEEIGMKNTSIPFRKIKDKLGKKYFPFYCGRDKARTPMQWDSSLYAGFSYAEPWLPINKNYIEVNVFKQKCEKKSLLNIYRELITLRKNYNALAAGDWKPLNDGKRGVLSYIRSYDNEKLLIILNFTNRSKTFAYNENFKTKIIFTTEKHQYIFTNNNVFKLNPYEGLIINLL